MGFTPHYLSQPVFLDALKPGQHSIGFNAPCHKTVEFTADVGIGDFYVPPVFLSETRSVFFLESSTPGQVSIDTKFGIWLQGSANFLWQFSGSINIVRIHPFLRMLERVINLSVNCFIRISHKQRLKR